MNNRLLRVRELIQRELGSMIVRDHQFTDVLVTINDVEITPDLKHANVYVGVIGSEQKAQNVVDKLNRQHGDYQTRMAKRVILKHTPHLHFKLDHSVERGVRITNIMEEIDRQLAESDARDAAQGTVP
jgi:ribosome-binding factor A